MNYGRQEVIFIIFSMATFYDSTNRVDDQASQPFVCEKGQVRWNPHRVHRAFWTKLECTVTCKKWISEIERFSFIETNFDPRLLVVQRVIAFVLVMSLFVRALKHFHSATQKKCSHRCFGARNYNKISPARHREIYMSVAVFTSLVTFKCNARRDYYGTRVSRVLLQLVNLIEISPRHSEKWRTNMLNVSLKNTTISRVTNNLFSLELLPFCYKRQWWIWQHYWTLTQPETARMQKIHNRGSRDHSSFIFLLQAIWNKYTLAVN